MDDTFSSTLKSVGAIVLTFALFLGVGYYVYNSLFVTPPPDRSDEIVAVHTTNAPANEQTITTMQKKPS